MFQGNEITTFLLGLGAFLFMLLNLGPLKRIPARGLLYLAFCLNLCSWTLTNLESLFLPQTLNMAEHICSTLDIAAFVGWLLIIIFRYKGRTL